MGKLNLKLGTNYWWNLEEMCSLVEPIGCGLFAIQSDQGQNVLHFFNPQRLVRRNIFVILRHNHYSVIDVKAKGHLNVDSIVEITVPSSAADIQMSILNHLHSQ